MRIDDLEGVVSREEIQKAVTDSIGGLLKGREAQIGEKIVASLANSQVTISRLFKQYMRGAAEQEVESLVKAFVESNRPLIREAVEKRLNEVSIVASVTKAVDDALESFKKIASDHVKFGVLPDKRKKPILPDDEDNEEDDDE